MTRKIKKFPGTSLDNKIPKDADFKTEYQKNFNELCRFFKLDPLKFKNLDASPWRGLSFKLIEHLVPGFQKNKSGRPQKASYLEDYLINEEIEILMGFDKLDSSGNTVPDYKAKIKNEIESVSHYRKLTKDQVRASRNRTLKRLKDKSFQDSIHKKLYEE